ncbi:biotin-dependent carboxyltransferase family protein [Thalassobacillus sp. CUG 92003]|uniref:5-oxoprolinase subunit C family protein n=1 Tax=Thalassobacillus sp. CUG 92003 TaxID=2736641 RepID=UPI0015E6F909|nr:biotin-dependent carboxyltransferase family protein [Thalassobacillus sp. CUG 92003]
MSEVAIFKTIKPGIYASFQDLGRFDYQKYGVPVSGAMDAKAHRLANYILGNPAHVPTLEITLTGTKLEALTDHWVAVTGGDLDAQLDGDSIPRWEALFIKKGQTLNFKGPKEGVRTYLAVQSGFHAPVFLGSASTYERGGFGQSLAKGDVLYAKQSARKMVRRGLIASERPVYTKTFTLNYIPSSHQSRFTEESITTFHQQPYAVKRGDRMGLQLQGGTALQHRDGADIISEPVTYGTIQVTSSGQPMILRADAQTTGGYTTLGTIMTKDLNKVAQVPPGGTVYFQACSDSC